jgi:hypothetical protein
LSDRSFAAAADTRLGHSRRGDLVGWQARWLVVDGRYHHRLIGLRAFHELAHLCCHGVWRADERHARPAKRIAGIAQVALPLLRGRRQLDWRPDRRLANDWRPDEARNWGSSSVSAATTFTPSIKYGQQVGLMA